jgi:twinkle protein
VNLIHDEIDFESYLNADAPQANVRQASEYITDLCESLHTDLKRKRVYLPWAKTRENFDFRKGEVTVWAGQNGHGKSHVTAMAALSMMGQGERVCVANFEAKPLTTMRKMARMFSGVNLFTAEAMEQSQLGHVERHFRQFGEWCHDKLWLYDQTGTQRGSKVIGMARYCAQELGIGQVFIDNLAKCIKDEDDYNGQKAFIDEACTVAAEVGIHIHIVHHLKKPPNESDRPDKNHVKGSGSIVDQPDNLMLVWRNKPKEDERKAGGHLKADEADTFVYCKKQRNFEGVGEGEPTIGLWLHRDSGQFLGSASESPLTFQKPYPHWHTEFTRSPADTHYHYETAAA